MDRRALLRGGAGVAGLAALSGCLDTTLDAVHGDVAFSLSIHRTHPADRPLVVDGLDSEGVRGWYTRLLTTSPRGQVFTDHAENVAPKMRSKVQSGDYDEQFFLVAELRFSEPMELTLSPSVTPRWKSWRRLQVPATAERIDDPNELREADSVVTTMLAAFDHEGTTPETLAMPVAGPDGRVATLWAT